MVSELDLYLLEFDSHPDYSVDDIKAVRERVEFLNNEIARIYTLIARGEATNGDFEYLFDLLDESNVDPEQYVDEICEHYDYVVSNNIILVK